MSHTCIRLVLFLLAAACSVATDAQTTIQFGNGPGTTTGDPSISSTTVYQESGFTLTTSQFFDPDFSSSLFRAAWTFGGVAHHGSFFPGTFSLAASDGRLFRLQGFDVADTTFDWTTFCAVHGDFSRTTPSIDVRGRLGGSDVFLFNARGACPPNPATILFTTATNPFSDFAVDELFFSAIGLEFVSADNIVLTAVPEPSSYALFVASLSAMGFWARRRRRTGQPSA